MNTMTAIHMNKINKEKLRQDVKSMINDERKQCMIDLIRRGHTTAKDLVVLTGLTLPYISTLLMSLCKNGCLSRKHITEGGTKVNVYAVVRDWKVKSPVPEANKFSEETARELQDILAASVRTLGPRASVVLPEGLGK